MLCFVFSLFSPLQIIVQIPCWDKESFWNREFQMLHYFYYKKYKVSALFFSQRKQFPEFLYHFSPITTEKKCHSALTASHWKNWHQMWLYPEHATFGLPLRKHLLFWDNFISVCTISSPAQMQKKKKKPLRRAENRIQRFFFITHRRPT